MATFLKRVTTPIASICSPVHETMATCRGGMPAFDANVDVIELPESIYRRDVALRLREADAIIGATDTMLSRVVLSRPEGLGS